LLDEVVAIGYATVKRKDLTGSVASVRSDDLVKVPSSDVTQALDARGCHSLLLSWLLSWQEFQETGRYATAQDLDQWLTSWGTYAEGHITPAIKIQKRTINI
jgi:hypothetical protein